MRYAIEIDGKRIAPDEYRIDERGLSFTHPLRGGTLGGELVEVYVYMDDGEPDKVITYWAEKTKPGQVLMYTDSYEYIFTASEKQDRRFMPQPDEAKETNSG